MRDFAKFLYTHNPFYLISAGSVLFGLRTAFESSNVQANNAWLLAESLAGYTILLAITAILIVRLGRVWDDARTIALLVILMLVAISASFDSLCFYLPALAVRVLMCGWLFSILVMELLIRGLRVHMPILYRFPLYLQLGLFYIFPLLLGDSAWSDTVWSSSVPDPWRVASYASVAGVLVLTLIPAVRKGKSLFADNGSPWLWPWYPWSAFFFLAVGVCGRAYLLTLSFQTDTGMQSTFGAYYLIPFGFAVLILIAEIAITEGKSLLQKWLVIAPSILVVISAWPGSSQVSTTFLNEVTRQTGSPLWLTAVACIAYSLYLRSRGILFATRGLAFFLVAMIFISPNTQQLRDMEVQNWWPLAMLSAQQFAHAIRRFASIPMMTAWTAMTGAMTIAWEHTEFTAHHGIYPIHVILLGFIVCSMLFSDDLARLLRKNLPIALLGLAIIAALAGLRPNQPRFEIAGYLAMICCVLLLMWIFSQLRVSKWATFGCASLLTTFVLITSIAEIQWQLPMRAVQALALGAGTFIAGSLISAVKGGLTLGVQSFIRREWELIVLERSSRS